MVAWYWVLIALVGGYFGASFAARFLDYNVLNYFFGYPKEGS